MTASETEDDFAPVDSIDGALVPPKVIEANENRLFHARAVILHKDHLRQVMGEQGHIFSGELIFENPVRVTDPGGQKALGFADVAWEGDRLVATVSLPYSSPERLTIETQPIWAESAFSVGFEQPTQLRSLFLSPRRPRDDRETPLAPVESR